MEAGPADDRFVFAFSDANFERYGITGQAAEEGETFVETVATRDGEK